MIKKLKIINTLLALICFLYLLLASNVVTTLPGKALKNFFAGISSFINGYSITFNIIFLFIVIVMLTINFICIKSENTDLTEKYEKMKDKQQEDIQYLNKKVDAIHTQVNNLNVSVRVASVSISYTNAEIKMKTENILQKASSSLNDIKHSYFTSSKHLYGIFVKTVEDADEKLKSILQGFINKS